MKGPLYEYKGEQLTQAEIARKVGVNRSTLADWYKKTEDMELAVEGALKSQKQRNIEYNGEILSLKAISEKENLKFETLKRYWDLNENIYEAVISAKEAQLKRNGSIEYNGSMLSLTAIAALEHIDRHALSKHYSNTSDIEESVRLTKEAQAKANGTVLYKGKYMTITGIAELEGIKRDTLKEYYEIYENIEKAVFITKESQKKRRIALLKGKQATVEDLSNYLGVSSIKINKMLDEGYSLDQIEEKSKKGTTKEDILKIDEESLYKYCIEHSYNYWVINYLIKTYNKTPESAIDEYLKNGQKVPHTWIYEKYGVLLKHLLLQYNLDSNRIVKIMEDRNCSIESAVEELVFVSNNENYNLKTPEINWLKELYPFLKECNEEELEEAKKTFYITDRELDYLKDKDEKIEFIKRQLLLFEFSRVVDIWPMDELVEMMELYDITDEEKNTIIIDLYSPFENKVINPKFEYSIIQDKIKKIILGELPDDSTLSDYDKEVIKTKRELLESIKKKNKEDRL